MTHNLTFYLLTAVKSIWLWLSARGGDSGGPDTMIELRERSADEQLKFEDRVLRRRLLVFRWLVCIARPVIA